MARALATRLGEAVIGALLIGATTSLPELVVAVTAIRAGALTLAVGDIVGGNAFDTLFDANFDIFYRDGSIYAAIADTERVWLGSAMLMNSVLLMALMYRERRGLANIAMESTMILVIYIVTVGYLATGAG